MFVCLMSRLFLEQQKNKTHPTPKQPLGLNEVFNLNK